MEWHSLLKRQIKKYFPDGIPQGYNQEFIKAVHEAYIGFDQDRGILERSLDLSSQELFQANTDMRAVFRAFPDLFFRVDHDGVILDHKVGGSADLFRPGEKLLGKKIQNIPDGNAGVLFQQAIDQVRKTQSTASIEYDVVVGGKKQFYEARFLPLSGAKIIIIIRNITERKNAEQALMVSEERYSIAVKGSNDGLWDWDLKSKQIYFSPQWKSLLGYSDAEIGTTPDEWYSRIHLEDRDIFSSKMDEHVGGAEPFFKCEYRMLHKDGRYLWMKAQGVALRDPEGFAYRIAGSQTDVTDRKIVEEQLLHNAFHDSLTGLPSRLLFMNRLRQSMEHSKGRSSEGMAVMFIDLDRFKLINDGLGHGMGDQLLIEVAKRLKACVRSSDTIARIGGDEFTVLMEHVKDSTTVSHLVGRIEEGLRAPFNLEGQEIYIAASIGVAMGSSDYDKPEDLMRDADTAMYRAKSSGGTFEIYDIHMHARVVSLLKSESELRRAVENQEFRIYYQPIIMLTTGRVVGFEALLRWQHGVRGLVAPAEIIPLAEETGLIIPIGNWVLKNACKDMVRWQKQFPNSPLELNVNMSYKQILQGDVLVSQIHDALNETKIPPHTLALEITESGIMENQEGVIRMIQSLRKLNIQIAIDDFGVGYSSLNYLHRLPIDKLKVDKSFLVNPGSSNETESVLKAIIALAHNLNIPVVAEGIEVMEQLSLLKELQCEFGQGYYFAGPMPAEAVAAFIQSNQSFHEVIK
jgi:diguanylate cyclase (GGDEF)-like protein/PAS domain S-box-containing protein